MATISWTAEAQRWLEDIFEYIAADDPRAAALTVQGIYGRVQDLPLSPKSVSVIPLLHAMSGVLLYGHYRDCYLVKGDGGVDVLGVFHGSLDITRYQL